MKGQTSMLGRREAPVAIGPLGKNQRLVRAHLLEHGPMTAAEAGALIHSERGHHPPDERCPKCDDDGRSCLISLRERDPALVVRRRVTATWEAVGWRAPSKQSDELPEGF